MLSQPGFTMALTGAEQFAAQWIIKNCLLRLCARHSLVCVFLIIEYKVTNS